MQCGSREEREAGGLELKRSTGGGGVTGYLVHATMSLGILSLAFVLMLMRVESPALRSMLILPCQCANASLLSDAHLSWVSYPSSEPKQQRSMS